jgi:hypothetical protein
MGDSSFHKDLALAARVAVGCCPGLYDPRGDRTKAPRGRRPNPSTTEPAPVLPSPKLDPRRVRLPCVPQTRPSLVHNAADPRSLSWDVAKGAGGKCQKRPTLARMCSCKLTALEKSSRERFANPFYLELYLALPTVDTAHET